ncbi:MAG: hypothetical protein ACK56Q_05850, partial [Pirellulaceae bacterium]
PEKSFQTPTTDATFEKMHGLRPHFFLSGENAGIHDRKMFAQDGASTSHGPIRRDTRPTDIACLPKTSRPYPLALKEN